MVYSLTHEKFTISQTSIRMLIRSLRLTCEIHDVIKDKFCLHTFTPGLTPFHGKRSKTFDTKIKTVILSMNKTDEQLKDILCKK